MENATTEMISAVVSTTLMAIGSGNGTHGPVGPPHKPSPVSLIVLNVVYAIGIIGNISALIILLHKDKVRDV